MTNLSVNLPDTSSLHLRRQVTVSEDQFREPVHCPFGDKVSLDDDEAMKWMVGDQGVLMRGQSLERSVAQNGGLVKQGPNGDGFVGPDNRAHVGQERTELGVQTDPNTGDKVFFYQRADGYDGGLTPRYVTEVRHAPNGTVTVLEYHQS